MSTKFYTLLTDIGAAKLASAAALGVPLKITHMAVGDGGGTLPTPDAKQTALVNEKRRAALNMLYIDPQNSSQIIAEQVIPENEGGWWIREVGLFDESGALIAVGNCPESYKPQLAEGSGRTQTVRMVLITSSTDNITLKIDPAVVLATRKYVDDKISEHEQSRRHPDASLTAKGFTQLSSATNSESEILAATPKAVKAAYDLAAGKASASHTHPWNQITDVPAASLTVKGTVQLSSATTAAVTRTSSALSWLAGAPLVLLRRGLASSGNAAGLLTAPLSSLRRTASLTGNVLKTVAGAPVALLRSGLSGLRAVAVMFMNPLAVLRGGLVAAGTVLRVLASGPLAMLRVALYAVSGLLGALLSPIGLVVTALAGVALVVWKYWQPITAFLGGVVEGFKAAAGPVSAAFEPLKPVFQWIGDKVQALWGWFTDLLTPVKSTSAELQSAAAMGRRFGEALAEGLNMVMHPLDSLKSGVSWLLEKLGIVSKEAAKAKLPESVTRQQPATVNADGKVMMPSGGFPSWGYGFAGMYDSGGYIPRGQFGIVGENGPEIVNGPANVTSRRNTAALAAVVAGMMGVAAAPAELPPLHPLALPAKGGEAMVSRAATVPPVQRIEAPMQIIIQTQPGQSAQDIAREVARQLDERERRLKAKARSNYSDQGGYDA